MIPPDTSMPVYDSPISVWPGIIALTVGILILIYLVVRVMRDYKRTHAQLAPYTTAPGSNDDLTDEPSP